MTDRTTIDKLHDLRLSAMADAFEAQLKDKSMEALSFADRFGILVDRQWDSMRSNKLAKLIKQAHFRYPNACMEDIAYLPDRKLDKSQMQEFATCRYISEGHNIIFVGASGSGKSYLANALGIAACRNYESVLYIRMPVLLDDLAVAHGEGAFKKYIKSIQRVKLLILDDFLLTPITNAQVSDLMEIIETKSIRGSIIFCSQFLVDGWVSRLGDNTVATTAEAIVDRIRPNSYEILIEGERSMRDHYGIHGDLRKNLKKED